MKTQLFTFLTLTTIVATAMGCGKGKSKSAVPDNGQLEGIAISARTSMTKPKGMVYVPPGTFHMGPSDEDINYSFTSRNKEVSIAGFWMDATEITNNEYRQFIYWTRDSLAAVELGYIKSGAEGDSAVDWKKAAGIKWGDKSTMEKLSGLVLAPDNRDVWQNGTGPG